MATVNETAVASVTLDGKAAGEEIKRLKKSAAELRKELKDLKIAGDKTGYEQKKRELDFINKQIIATKRSTWDLDKVMKNLNGSSLKDLERAQRQLTNEVRNSNRETKEEIAILKVKAQQIKDLKSKITAVRNEMNLSANASQGMLSRIAHSMNNYFLFAMSAVASFTAVITGAKQAITTFAEWDDKLADVRKTTGFTREEVSKLNESLKKVNTRSAQMELLDLARVAGKLGYDGVEDVEGFVKAADQIKVALTEDLGGDVEESIRQVGKLADIFKLKDQYGIEQALLKTGSAINALGASSTANEGYMVEFTKRVAGVAPAANISIQDILGLASTLDQLGQTSEVSSTVFSQIIPDMFRNTQVYAKTAGMSVEKFSALLKEDANEAMIQMLQGLNGNNSGMEHMVMVLDELGVEGKRAISVLGALANNTDLLRETQKLSNEEFEKGTSLTDEFNIKNNTMQARLEKAKKSLFNVTVELGQKLAPALTFSTNSVSYLIRAMNGMIEIFAEYKGIIVPAVAAIASYTIAVNAVTIAKKAYTIATNIATAATKLFNTAIKSNPVWLIVAGITAATTALLMYRSRANEVTATQRSMDRITKETSSEFDNQAAKIDHLVAVMKNENMHQRFRIEAIRRLKEIIPGYNAMISSEGKIINENKQALQDYMVELEKQIRMKSAQAELEELFRKKREAEKNIKTAESNLDETRARNRVDVVSGGEAGIAGSIAKLNAVSSAEKRLEKTKKELQGISDAIVEVEQEISTSSHFKKAVLGEGSESGNEEGTLGSGTEAVGKLKTAYELLGEEISKAKAKMMDFITKGMHLEAQQTGILLDSLENQEFVIKKIAEYSGDVGKFLKDLTDDTAALNAEMDEDLFKGLEQYSWYIQRGKEPAAEPDKFSRQRDQAAMAGLENRDKGPQFDKDFYLSSIETTANAAFDIWRNQTDARLDYELNALNVAMEKELANKNLTEEQKDKIREKYAKKEKLLKTQAFKKQKTADIIQAIINTALAVTRALPNVPLSIAAGIAGAAQVATIAAQPIPQFSGGGFTGKGIGYNDGNGNVAGLVHENEYVIPEWMRSIPQVISFERVLEGIRTGRSYATGGNTSASAQTTNIYNQPPVPADTSLTDAVNRLNSILQGRIYTKLSLLDLEEIQDKKTEVENMATL